MQQRAASLAKACLQKNGCRSLLTAVIITAQLAHKNTQSVTPDHSAKIYSEQLYCTGTGKVLQHDAAGSWEHRSFVLAFFFVTNELIIEDITIAIEQYENIWDVIQHNTAFSK
jgi:hypothetical protein